MLKEYVVDESAVAKFKRQKYLLTADGGPQARLSDNRPEAGESPTAFRPPSAAHLHLPAQFYLVLRGTAKFPRNTINGLGVHYTDPGVAYGPFTTTFDSSRIVVDATPGGIIWMADPEARKHVNRTGREYFGSVADRTWEPGPNGSRKVVLFRDPQGAAAEVLECPPGKELAAGPSEFGRFEIVVKGTVSLQGRKLPVNSLRYIIGDEAAGPMVAGPEGATIVLLTFDKASVGNFTGSIFEQEEAGSLFYREPKLTPGT